MGIIEISHALKAPKGTISGIISNLEKHGSFELNDKQFRQRKGDFDLVEDKLLHFVNHRNEHGLITSGAMMISFASLFKTKMEEKLSLLESLDENQRILLQQINKFAPSESWLSRFKKRKNLKAVTVYGEAKSADVDAFASYLPFIHSTTAMYDANDVYNCDELGLFYKQTTSTTIGFKASNLKGKTVPKDRITVLLCCNTTGTHKLPPLVIGKYQNPRCLKNVSINSMKLDYRANNSAWMTKDLFEQWLHEFDRSINKATLLILDNVSSHKININLFRHLNFLFLPPNCTSICQPLDQGIIRSFKSEYRSRLLAFKSSGLISINEQNDLVQICENQVDLKNALLLLRESWDAVTCTVIQNCFRKCRLFRDVNENEIVAMEALMDLQNVVTHEDEEVFPTSEVLHIEPVEFIDNLMEKLCLGDKINEEVNSEDDIYDTEEVHIVKPREALFAANILSTYMEQNPSSLEKLSEPFLFMRNLKFNIYNYSKNNLVQKKLSDLW